MLTRRTAAILASASLAAGPALGACTSGTPPPRPPDTVALGLLVDAEGGDAQTGAELAVEIVNGSYPELALPLAGEPGLGGLGGAELVLAVGESGGDTAGAGAAMRELHTRRHVAGVVALGGAGAVETAAGYANREELPLVDAATSADYLLDLGLSWYFRTGPSDRQLAGAVFAALAAHGDPGRRYRVATLTPSVSRGSGVATRLATQAEAAGFTATGSVAAGDGAEGRLAGADPDIVIAIAPAAGDGPGLYEVIEGWQALAPDDPHRTDPVPAVAGLGPGFAPARREQAPGGMLYPAAWSAELAGRTPLAQAVAARHQERYGAPLTEAGAHAFTATLVLAAALDAAGGTEPVATRAALRQLSVPATRIIMPWNGIRFGEDGQNALAAAIVEQAVAGGADGGGGGTRLIHPPELAETDPVWR